VNPGLVDTPLGFAAMAAATTVVETRTLRRPGRLASFWAGIDGIGGQAWALVGVAAFVVFVAKVLQLAGMTLLPGAIAVLIGVMVAPLVGLLERRGMNRLGATILVFVGVFVLVGVFVWLIVPPFVSQASRFLSGLPDTLHRIAEVAKSFERRVAVANPAAANAVEGFTRALETRATEFAGSLSDSVVGMVNVTITVVVSGFLGTVVAFLAVKDLPRYVAPCTRWLDRPGRERVSGALRQMKRTGTGFVRGQLILSLLGGVLSAIAFGLLGVPFFLPLAALAAVGRLIPGIGPVIAAVPAVALAWSKGGPVFALVVLILVIALTEGLSMVIGPLIVGQAVEMPALAVMVILLVAGGLIGAGSVIIAVPLVGMIRDGLRWFWMDDAAVATALAEASGP